MTTPYSLSVKNAAIHFGFSPKWLYDIIATGRLHREYHYLKVGRRVVIIRDRFIEWMQEQDRGEASYGGEIQERHPVP